MDDVVQELVDRNAIRQCIYRYIRGADRVDRELVRSAFHDDAIIKQGDLRGGVDELVEWSSQRTANRLMGQHFVTNHVAEIDGDIAHAETYIRRVSADVDGPLVESGGRYIDRLERRDGQWRIVVRVSIVEWWAEMTGAAGSPPGPSWAKGARDRSDLSYQRPLEP